MELAYDPDRVRALLHRVQWSIDEIGRCHCDDPAAVAAHRALRLTRQNLEDQWMPTLRAIERSTGMVSWTASGPPPMSSNPDTHRLIELLARRPWFDDVGALVHAGIVAQGLRALLDDPQACLDVLSDRSARFSLAQWDALPDDLVQEFVTTAMYRAVVDAPQRLEEGFVVWRDLTELANGALDDGFRPGFARGVSLSLGPYLPVIAAGLRQTGDRPVHAIDEAAGVDVELGSYDDVADLFGALLRDEVAQAALGTLLGSYAVRVVSELGAEVNDRPGVDHVAAMAMLLADAAVGEQAELVADAARRQAARQSLGEATEFVAGAALSATGAGAVVNLLARSSLSLATDRLTDVEADRLPGDPIPASIHDAIGVASIAVLTERLDVRAALGLDVGTTDRQWAEVSRRLGQIETAPTAHDRAHRIASLERWLDAELPLVAGHVGRVRSHPAVHDLAHTRTTTDPDDD